MNRGLTFLILLMLAAPSLAETRVAVEMGFNNAWRVGEWGPVTVSVQSDKLQEARLSLSMSGGTAGAINITQGVTLNTGPNRFVMLAPLPFTQHAATLRVSDPRSGKTLASWPDEERDWLAQVVSDRNRLIVAAGQVGGVSWLESGENYTRDVSVVIPPARLPDHPIAYRGVDALVLAGAELSSLTIPQQQAIVFYLRGGGKVLMWPGEEPLAPGPLMDVLPGTPGPADVLALEADQLKDLGLPDRFRQLPHRPITLAADATELRVHEALPPAQVRRVGRGQIVLLSWNPARLTFTDSDGAEKVLAPLRNHLLGPEKTSNDYQYYVGPSSADAAAMEVLGNIEGVGAFGFEYVVAALLALAMLVGPVDWFVLRRIGRQPWTWSTTAGWALLITAAAVLAGSMLKSGQLEMRTLEVVDEDAGTRTLLMALYSPRTASYALEVPDGTHWSGVDLSGSYYRTAAPAGQMLRFQQTPDGTHPLPLRVPVWNLSMLRGEGAVELDMPLIDATLQRRSDALTGTVSLADQPMQAVLVETAEGTLFVDVPDGNQSVDLKGQLTRTAGREYPQFYPQQTHQSPARQLMTSVAATTPVEQGWAIVSVLVEEVPPQVSLQSPPDAQQHWQIRQRMVQLAD